VAGEAPGQPRGVGREGRGVGRGPLVLKAGKELGDWEARARAVPPWREQIRSRGNLQSGGVFDAQNLGGEISVTVWFFLSGSIPKNIHQLGGRLLKDEKESGVVRIIV